MDTSINDPRLIALYSPRPQQGKSEVAKFLGEHGFVNVKFAEPIKVMVAQFLLSVGIPKGKLWDYIEGSKKEVQIPGLPKGITSRHLQRTIGTEWGRKCVGENVWINIAFGKAQVHLNEGRSVVIDDMRFPNEYAAAIRNGSEVWRIVRSKETFKSDGHSEALLEGKFFDLNVHNDKTIKVLRDGISAVLGIGPPLGQLPRSQ